jgi:uncharacterized membrane protein
MTVHHILLFVKYMLWAALIVLIIHNFLYNEAGLHRLYHINPVTPLCFVIPIGIITIVESVYCVLAAIKKPQE